MPRIQTVRGSCERAATMNTCVQANLPIAKSLIPQSCGGTASPGAIAARFARLVEQLGGDTAAAKAMGQQRDLLAAVDATEPAERSTRLRPG